VIQPALDPETLRRTLARRVFGNPLIYEQWVGSTNDLALDLLEKGYPEGTLVLSEEQTHGRGRRERTWDSPPRLGIYASLILRPEVPPSVLPLLSFAAATGIARTLEKGVKKPVRIKWPNDLQVAGRKMAGLLAEGRSGTCRPGIVIGIGLNVNHRESDFPSEIRGRVTSLRIESSRVWDRTLLIPGLLETWEEEHRILAAGGSREIIRRWEQFSALTPGAHLRVDLDTEVRTGRYLGVGPAGELRLQEEDGGTCSVTFGDVRHLRED